MISYRIFLMLSLTLFGFGLATGGDSLKMFTSETIPHFSFDYAPEVWELEVLESEGRGGLFAVVLTHIETKETLSFTFSLVKEKGFVDCIDVFLPEDLVFVGNTVRIFQNHNQSYRYFSKSQFIFRRDDPVMFQSEAEAWIKYKYGESVPNDFAQNVIALGGCNEEPIFTWGTDVAIDTAIQKWDMTYYRDMAGNCVWLWLGEVENEAILGDVDQVMASLIFKDFGLADCGVAPPLN